MQPGALAAPPFSSRSARSGPSAEGALGRPVPPSTALPARARARAPCENFLPRRGPSPTPFLPPALLSPPCRPQPPAPAAPHSGWGSARDPRPVLPPGGPHPRPTGRQDPRQVSGRAPPRGRACAPRFPLDWIGAPGRGVGTWEREMPVGVAAEAQGDGARQRTGPQQSRGAQGSRHLLPSPGCRDRGRVLCLAEGSLRSTTVESRLLSRNLCSVRAVGPWARGFSPVPQLLASKYTA